MLECQRKSKYRQNVMEIACCFAFRLSFRGVPQFLPLPPRRVTVSRSVHVNMVVGGGAPWPDDETATTSSSFTDDSVGSNDDGEAAFTVVASRPGEANRPVKNDQ